MRQVRRCRILPRAQSLFWQRCAVGGRGGDEKPASDPPMAGSAMKVIPLDARQLLPLKVGSCKFK
jgi:hypothetical protein